MRQAKILAVTIPLVFVVLAAAVLVNYRFVGQSGSNQQPFHVGVSFCGNTTAQAKLLIDRVKNYTNLLVIQSGPVSKNETSLTEIARLRHRTGLRYNSVFWHF